MSEKSLLSLREIARELNLNYRIMVNYKNQIQNLLPGKEGGQFNKYPSECIDLFRLVSMLREEGYAFEMIRNMLTGQEALPEDEEIKEWVASWVAILSQINRDQSGLVQTDPDQSGSIRIGTDQSRPIQTNPDQAGSIQSDPDQSGADQTDPEQSGLVQSNQDRSGQVRTDPDFEERFQDMLDHSLSRLESRLLTEFSDLIPQLNSALTQFYKFSHELLARLEKIETELGVEAEPLTTELDLEAMQVKMEPAYSHADLDFVRNSVHEGKPDKNAVKQWVLSERRKGPEQSYAVLAEVLNEAGVPTLSGREGWNRGTLRNIVAER